ncbi:hypothetical protein DFH11DRAFT_1604938 [Phellopilus nigrolimitatus]|nr:hypothetical protein DFH11DRAFT_1604938 [Phellopilus nigrolimitatus]
MSPIAFLGTEPRYFLLILFIIILQSGQARRDGIESCNDRGFFFLLPPFSRLPFDLFYLRSSEQLAALYLPRLCFILAVFVII